MLNSWRKRLLVLACLTVIFLPPAMAYATSTFFYYWNTNHPGVTGMTPGYAARNYNEVWHQFGYWFHVNYCMVGDPLPESYPNYCPHGLVMNTENPTQWMHPNGYAQSRCHNWNDTSGVRWTCQSTQP